MRFDSSANDSNALIGNQGPLGVDYQWHKPSEYQKLSNAKKKDLDDWRVTPGDQAATKKQLEEHFCSKRKAKVSSTKAKSNKSSARTKKFEKSKESKKAKAAL